MASLNTVAHKVYLSLVWVLGSLAVLIVVTVVAVVVHDNKVVNEDFACFDRETALEVARLNERQKLRDSSGISASSHEIASREFTEGLFDAIALSNGPQVGDKCNIYQPPFSSDESFSLRTWSWWGGAAFGQRDHPRGHSVLLAFLGFAPLGLCIGLNRWVRWLIR